MNIKQTPLEGCLIIENKIFKDDRGYFQETYHQQTYDFLPTNTKFIQDNLSYSHKNVLRGIHFQKKFPQGKLIRVTKGSIFDVAVDLRPSSSTFGQHFSIILSEKNHLQFWIPEGFGHGFLSLEDSTYVEYKCTQFYRPEDEQCLLWNDKILKIQWPNDQSKFQISKKDLLGQTFSSLKDY